jgi:hypothetical protein
MKYFIFFLITYFFCLTNSFADYYSLLKDTNNACVSTDSKTCNYRFQGQVVYGKSLNIDHHNNLGASASATKLPQTISLMNATQDASDSINAHIVRLENKISPEITKTNTKLDSLIKIISKQNQKDNTNIQNVIISNEKMVSEFRDSILLLVDNRISEMQKNMILRINQIPKPVDWTNTSYDEFKKRLITDLDLPD